MTFSTDTMEVYKQPSAVIRWFDTPEGTMLLNYIQTIIEYSQDKLEKEKDTVEIYRLQGRIDGLKEIFDLPQELEEYLKRKMVT